MGLLAVPAVFLFPARLDFWFWPLNILSASWVFVWYHWTKVWLPQHILIFVFLAREKWHSRFNNEWFFFFLNVWEKVVLTRSKIYVRGKARIALLTSEDQLVGRSNILVETGTQLIFAKFFFPLSKPCVSSVFKQRVKQIFVLWADVYSTQTTRRLLSMSQKLESTTGKAASVSDSSLAVAWTQQLSATPGPSLLPFLDIHEVKNISFPVKHHSTKKITLAGVDASTTRSRRRGKDEERGWEKIKFSGLIRSSCPAGDQLQVRATSSKSSFCVSLVVLIL